MIVIPCTLLAVAAVAALDSAGSDTAIIYDKAGKHAECAEGPRAYMEDCVMPSDYYSYILSAEPTLEVGKTCASLGTSNNEHTLMMLPVDAT